MAEDVERVSVTVPPDLLADIDEVVARDGYDSRSEAARDALRAFVTETRRERGDAGTLSGTVVVLYDHDESGVTEALTRLQHEFADTVIAVHHVHLGTHLCLESVAVSGDAADVEEMVSRLRPLKGVRGVELAVVEAGR